MIDYIRIARFDHWGKNVFMLLGFVLAWFLRPVEITGGLLFRLVAGFVLTGLVASSNYVINEILDAPRDRHHPEKKDRPVASGRVRLSLAYGEWVVLGALGLVGAWFVGFGFFLSAVALWGMGCVYNIPPLRTKELPWLDVISESVNNPLRLFLGWFVVIPHRIPPLSLVIAYWMFGAFFMAIKRYAEYRHINNPTAAAAYRNSFRWYTEERLLVSFFFYALTGAFFGGVFTLRYRLELLLFLPVAAAFLTYYLKIGLWVDSPVQHPEKLFLRKRFLGAALGCLGVFLVLMVVEIPELYYWFNVDPDHRMLWRLPEP